MAATIATARLRKELQKLQVDPPPGIIAEPKENDILVWFFAIRGPSDTVFEEGVYVGKLKFPPEYPMKAPAIYMLTPSGRFQTNTQICMSMSNFHPESWNPLWSVSTIIQGVQSFMASSEMTTGGLSAPESEQRKLAERSKAFNLKTFPNLFHGDFDAAFQKADQARQVAEKKALVASASTGSRTVSKLPKADGDTAKSKGNSKGSVQVDSLVSQAKELTSEEIEKRRKKNAKKREKQKAKKAAAVSSVEE